MKPCRETYDVPGLGRNSPFELVIPKGNSSDQKPDNGMNDLLSIHKSNPYAFVVETSMILAMFIYSTQFQQDIPTNYGV